MKHYCRVYDVFKRDTSNDQKRLMKGVWATPEIEYLANNTWTFTEKVVGENVSVTFKDGEMSIWCDPRIRNASSKCTKRLNDLLLSATEKINEIFIDSTVTLYGRFYGGFFQGASTFYPKDENFVLFDIRQNHTWLKRADVERVAKRLGIDVVPVIGEGTLRDAVDRVRTNLVSAWGNFQAPGIVARPKVELIINSGRRLIVKIDRRDFIT